MASLELEGTLLQKLSVQSGTSSRGTWEKQEFVVEVPDGNYTNKVVFNVWGADKVKELASVSEGSAIRVSFNISSREFNGRWYTDLRAWRISPAGQGQPAPAPVYTKPSNIGNGTPVGGGNVPAGFGPSAPAPTMDDFKMPEGEDDLPF